MSCPPSERRRGLVLLFVLLAACGRSDTELARSHAYMDSLRVYLGELRRMDHELDQIVTGDTLAADFIVPPIAERFRPKVADLRRRAAALPTTVRVDSIQALLLDYLDLRLQAYDAAIRGHAEDRPELFDTFARKQIAAQTLGERLEAQVQTLRQHLPGYD